MVRDGKWKVVNRGYVANSKASLSNTVIIAIEKKVANKS